MGLFLHPLQSLSHLLRVAENELIMRFNKGPPRSTLANGAVSRIRPTAVGVLASVSCSLLACGRRCANAGRSTANWRERAVATSRSSHESGAKITATEINAKNHTKNK